MELVFVCLPYLWSYVWTAKRCTLGTQQTPVKNWFFVYGPWSWSSFVYRIRGPMYGPLSGVHSARNRLQWRTGSSFFPSLVSYWSPGFAGDVRHPNYEKEQVYPRRDSLSLFVPSRDLLVFWLRRRRSSSVHQGGGTGIPCQGSRFFVRPCRDPTSLLPSKKTFGIHRSQGGTGLPYRGFPASSSHARGPTSLLLWQKVFVDPREMGGTGLSCRGSLWFV
ncbi:unnamed protein product [Cuscuta epithymum]|uniref:Secreted protein n=1 Tax=Cuscuta epithymum TaxID=186058 RepID=A0AAV0CYI0_9ASTE|nr:unnamed protein product [Cuscuta epithymum]